MEDVSYVQSEVGGCPNISIGLIGFDVLVIHLDELMCPYEVWVRTLEIKRRQTRNKCFKQKGVIYSLKVYKSGSGSWDAHRRYLKLGHCPR